MNYPLAFIGNLGTTEIALIVLVIFLLFGAKKLPELARGLGKSLGEFKKAKSEFEDELMNSDVKKEDNSKSTFPYQDHSLPQQPAQSAEPKADAAPSTDAPTEKKD